MELQYSSHGAPIIVQVIYARLLSYNDHGTGHRLAAKINNLLFDVMGVPIGCGVTIEPGISSACAVVKTGGGGVLQGDVVFLATADGRVFTDPDEDRIIIGLWRPTTPLDADAPISLESCLEATIIGGGNPYYDNEGVLGGGNLTWFGEE